MAMTPLLGFQPDLNPDIPGVMTECRHVIPYEQGFTGAPTGSAANAAALAAECRGARVVTKLDETRRIFAGTQTKLYELTGTTWTDRSAGGGSYTGSLDSRWSYAVQHLGCICCNRWCPKGEGGRERGEQLRHRLQHE